MVNKNVITCIEVQKRNKYRVNVYVDDEFEFACNAELVYKYHLEKGKQIDRNELGSLIAEDNYLKAKSLGLKYVENAMKPEKKVEEYLINKGYDEKTSKRVIEFLVEYRFIDDDRYAKEYIRWKIKDNSVKKISYELQKKGIDKEIVNKYIDELQDEEEEKAAITLAEKKLKNLLGRKFINKVEISNKIKTFLAGKGYSYSVINKTITSLRIEDYYKGLDRQNEDGHYEKEQNNEEIKMLFKKKYNLLMKSQDEPTLTLKNKKKLYDFLLRKGYNYEVVDSIFRTMEE